MNFKKMAAALTGFLMACSNASAANYMLGAFFSSDSDVNMQLCRSDDKIRMEHVLSSTEVAGRDPSIRYYNGAFYVCLVESAESGKTFKILRSPDLIQWTTTGFDVIDRGGDYSAVWAPDLFIDDDGAAYVYFAKQKGVDRKSGEKKFDIWVSKSDSLEQPEFRAAEKIDLAGFGNVIDAHVCKLDGRYYMIAKNEAWLTNNDNKSPILFRSDNPIDGFAEVKEFPLRAVRGYEGFSIAKDDGKIYIYGDNYSGKYDAFPTSHYTVWIADEENIETGPYRAEYVESSRPLRHGSVILIDDAIADKAISQLTPETPDENSAREIEERTLEFTREDFGGDKKLRLEIEEFAPAPRVTYRIRSKMHVEIKKLVNAYGIEKFEVILAPGASIHIDNVFIRDNDDKKDRRHVIPTGG